MNARSVLLFFRKSEFEVETERDLTNGDAIV